MDSFSIAFGLFCLGIGIVRRKMDTCIYTHTLYGVSRTYESNTYLSTIPVISKISHDLRSIQCD